ncbi:hypothetical protein [Pseudomonas sp. NPDC086251]|uniref:hypothetical protein n=1 Tax=Pseudomonas sp. NPDC086251 TaxID=3364431 RepID=UPI0038324E70
MTRLSRNANPCVGRSLKTPRVRRRALHTDLERANNRSSPTQSEVERPKSLIPRYANIVDVLDAQRQLDTLVRHCNNTRDAYILDTLLKQQADALNPGAAQDAY